MQFRITYQQESSKMFKITLKYFCIFDDTPTGDLVMHITRDFVIRYSCSYYSHAYQDYITFISTVT